MKTRRDNDRREGKGRPAMAMVLCACLAVLVAPQPLAAQTFGEANVSRWQVGMMMRAAGPCRDLHGYLPVPKDWPEQQVTVLEEDISPEVSVRFETVDDGARILDVRVPQLAAGREVKALITLRVLRGAILPPDDMDGYVLPEAKRLPPAIATHLLPSPKIESDSPQIQDLAKTIGTDRTAWRRAEAIYDWVREHVRYEEGPWKGALAALNDGSGDCEECSALFIAICRAAGIPARTVWVPDHCYAEFYLEDRRGQGRWFPCQSAGTREFGEITEFAPILQKGDSFRPPPNGRERQRYMAEFLSGTAEPGRGPQVTMIRDRMDSESSP